MQESICLSAELGKKRIDIAEVLVWADVVDAPRWV